MNKKVLAVIPARAGSKGIPNKNLRLLNGKPLIYYSIEKAKKSQYITDIIVTTDSPYIAMIAKQLGVKVKNRDISLCGDNITLDSVIFDAIQNFSLEIDIVVTMQPTSPTLKVESLDKAIDSFLSKDLDTIISVVNAPHLSWKYDDTGQIIPNYTERLNRQYLPENFIETGAFLITKKEFITPNNRIGKNIAVHEISEEESIDIDNFSDLILSEYFLTQPKKVGIYVNGNNQIGLGHIHRILEIADEFFVKPDIYFDNTQTDKKVFGETTHTLIAIKNTTELFTQVNNKNYDIFINDILDTTTEYMINLKRHLPNNAKIINFEDEGGGILEADLVINALYDKELIPNMKSGEKYYISPKIFSLYDPIVIKDHVEKIFISFGGADPSNYTDDILNLIANNPKYESFHFIVVIGKAKNNAHQLTKYNIYDNIEIHYDVYNMPELMSQCDIALISRGRTGYEVAMLGIPSIVMAQNEREEKHHFISNENGFSYIGMHPSLSMIEGILDIYLHMSKLERQMFQDLLLKHNLKTGRKRVINLINSLLD